MDDSAIFPFLKAKATTGQPTALVTVTAVTGGSVRDPGAHMAVAMDGDFAGSLSGGCIEAAIVAEAIEVMEDGRPREVRFGAGSPYIDIRLPCGGAVDLLINPVDADFARGAAAVIEQRNPLALHLPLLDGTPRAQAGEGAVAPVREGGWLSLTHAPALTIIGIGNGAALEALARHCDAARMHARFHTPERALAERLAALGHGVTLLRMPTDAVDWHVDRWTAFAFLFHDHDWEAELLARALATPAFYIGAMGSRATHARRIELLSDRGILPRDLARIRGPIGLIPAARDPETLAISILAEIVRDYNLETATGAPRIRMEPALAP